jgi:hypothetical protein
MNSAEELRGYHVVEVGVRQAWPFLTFCSQSGDREIRLYLDSDMRVSPVQSAWVSQSSAAAISALHYLNMQTVDKLHVGSDGSLRISFLDEHRLEVRGEANAETSGDVWWLGAEN